MPLPLEEVQKYLRIFEKYKWFSPTNKCFDPARFVSYDESSGTAAFYALREKVVVHIPQDYWPNMHCCCYKGGKE